MAYRTGNIQRKILLLLLGGITLGLTRSPRGYYRTLRLMRKEWREIERDALYRAIKSLYKSRLIREKHNPDGTITITLSENGRKRALRYNLDTMKIKEAEVWDGKWRIFAFDIPEKKKSLRNSIRFHFRQIGLKEFQKSIFVHPYPCNDEVDFLLEFYQARSYVRNILAQHIDNELHLKKKFGLL
ncbi:MAG: phenylacetic acid degradation operon negative regulatory protein [Parcubacteria group bacterium Gr01-1014_33]|nr:MAG: phenylacetic acid degradation operon negative regulatory protein [Parcubacteria group bacterium Gr01-1014_33]